MSAEKGWGDERVAQEQEKAQRFLDATMSAATATSAAAAEAPDGIVAKVPASLAQQPQQQKP